MKANNNRWSSSDRFHKPTQVCIGVYFSIERPAEERKL